MPSMRRELTNVAGLVRRKACQHVLQGRIEVRPSHARRLDHAPDGRGASSRAQASNKQPAASSPPMQTKPPILWEARASHFFFIP